MSLLVKKYRISAERITAGGQGVGNSVLGSRLEPGEYLYDTGK